MSRHATRLRTLVQAHGPLTNLWVLLVAEEVRVGQMTTGRGAALSRSIGVPGAILLGLGSMVGTGVFVSLHIAGAVAGPAVILAVGIAAVVAAANALSSAQLAAAHPVSGGTYEYGYRFLHPAAGFGAGWMFLLAKSASAATAALAFAAYLRAILPVPWTNVTVALVLVAALLAVTLAGLRRTTVLNALIVSITLGSLIVFIVLALPDWRAANLRPFLVPEPGRTPLGALLYAAALTFVAFTGYGRIATLGEEIREPERNIPRAIRATVVIVAVLYGLVALAGAGTVGTATLGDIALAGGAPLEEAAATLGGSGARTVLAVGALVATLGVLLNLLLGLSRVLLAMGRRADMPRITAHVSDGTPRVALVIMAAVVAGLVLVGDVRATWSFSAITVLLYYATANAAALAVSPAQRIIPRWISLGGLIGCLALAGFVDAAVLVWGVLALGSGLLWFGGARLLERLRAA